MRWFIKKSRYEKWEIWFAWYPVEIKKTGMWVLLENVNRITYYSIVGDYYGYDLLINTPDGMENV